jgi:hypothetical protein
VVEIIREVPVQREDKFANLLPEVLPKVFDHIRRPYDPPVHVLEYPTPVILLQGNRKVNLKFLVVVNRTVLLQLLKQLRTR